jgi:hypothetical protein
MLAKPNRLELRSISFIGMGAINYTSCSVHALPTIHMIIIGRETDE